MTPEPRGATPDERMEILLGRVLRIGVLLASALVISGASLLLWKLRGAKADYRAFRGEMTVSGDAMSGELLGPQFFNGDFKLYDDGRRSGNGRCRRD